MGVNQKKRQLRRDELLLWVWPVVAAIVSLLVNANFFVGICLFLILPGLFLSVRNPKYVLKSLLFSFVAIIAFIVIDYISVKGGQWFFPHSVIPYRLFGVVAFEGVLWTFTWIYFIIMYYEYFLEEHTPRLYYRPLKYLFIAFLILLTAFLVVKNINDSLLNIPYSYLIVGIIFTIIPLVCTLLKFPNLFSKFMRVAVYFALFSLVWELVAVPLGQWSFPGRFIGWIELFGVRFPFEEFLVWILLGSIGVLSWYEVFDDEQC